MSITLFPQNFPPATTPLVDPKTGIPTQFGRFLLLALFNRTGAEQGIPYTVSDALTATGTTQATALTLADDWNWVTTAAVNSGVIIPQLQPGQSILVQNDGANTLSVYPPGGGTIDVGLPRAAYALPAGKMQVFRFFTTSQIKSMQLG